ncbi:Gfo/Idh/MocA family oxidoreductase [Candidatus Poribacteria bacterium]|nr:Gfo/Idh/MocA family oxidoreductase [Candidatus Poribacteria bacterium]
MEPVKLGYVGCGFMAQKVHIPNFISIRDCELMALAEVRPKLGRKVQERYKIPRLYEHHLELAKDQEIEAVAVSADFALQGEIAKDLLRAGKHVFMEKPMAVSVEQAELILEAGRQSGKKLMVGYMKRYDAGNELVKSTVSKFRETGELGRLTYARNHGFCGDWVCNLDTPMETTDESKPSAPVKAPEWLPAKWVGPYLGYLQQYTHNINLLRWLLDAGDKVQVKTVDLDDNGYTGIVIFDMAGVRVTLETGSISHYRWDEHTQIYFEHGWVHTWAPPLLLKNTPAEVEIYRAGEAQEISRPVPKPRWTWSYRREAEHFIANVRSDEPFRSSGEDTLNDVRLFEEIYRMFLEQR